MMTIRPARAEDASAIIALIRALAEYEREPDAVRITEEDILKYGFGEHPRFSCLLAEWEGVVAGFALYFFSFSTWEGKPGLYLEDLFVCPEYRGRGIGRELMIRLAQIGLDEECTRFHWQVLDWNTPAREFYEALGAVCLQDWLPYRISGAQLVALSGSGTGSEQEHG